MRTFEDVIGAAKFVPVLREDSPETVVDRGRLLLEGGWPLVEIAATTPQWPKALEALRAEFTEVVIGVGTILSLDGAKQARDLGANFLVCPHLDATLVAEVPELLIQGGFTPGEIYAACAAGLGKLFPCHVLDPSYLRSILAVYPGLRVMPTGGLSVDAGAEWLSEGAFSVGVGSSLFTLDDPLSALAAARAQFVASVESEPI